MCVVWMFQDEDSENSPLRKTAAHLSGRAARLSALPAARSCTPPSYPPRLVPAAPCTRRALYPPRFVPALRPRFRTPPPPHPAVSRSPLCPARRCVPLAVVSRSPLCPARRLHPFPAPAAPRRLPSIAAPRRAALRPPLVPAALPSAPAAVIFRAAAPRFRNKSVSLSPYCAPPARQWLRPANGSGPPTRPANGPGPPTRSGLCCCFRAEPSGGRPGPRRVPGRTPTSDP